MRDPGRSTLGLASGTGAATSAASVNGPTVKRLTPCEIVQQLKDGKCFHCDEFFTNDHKPICRQLFIIEVVAEEELDGQADTAEPTISLHAITGIQPRMGKTMQLLVAINGVHLRALLDLGLTHNFIDTVETHRAGIS
jgi:hypothetical protein